MLYAIVNELKMMIVVEGFHDFLSIVSDGCYFNTSLSGHNFNMMIKSYRMKDTIWHYV